MFTEVTSKYVSSTGDMRKPHSSNRIHVHPTCWMTFFYWQRPPATLVFTDSFFVSVPIYNSNALYLI